MCTTNDAFDANCNCVGTFQDSDNDGTCDALEVACIDGAPIGETIAFRKCGGDENWFTSDPSSDLVYADGDNFADAHLFVVEAHPDGCIAFRSVSTGQYLQVVGNRTDPQIRVDGNSALTWEHFAWNDLGNGQVAIQSIFNDGWIGADLTINNAPVTDSGDNISANETLCFVILSELSCTIDASCDDGDVCTTNDVFDANCNCVGTFQDSDNDGICDALDCLVGASCDDGDVCTINDALDANCDCAGIFQDSDNDGTCDALEVACIDGCLLYTSPSPRDRG